MPHSDGEDWIASHEAFKCSRTWDNLAFDGIQGGGGTLLVEHLRCPDCGSTISHPVDMTRASDLISRLSAVLSVSLDAVATPARACVTTKATRPSRPSNRRRNAPYSDSPPTMASAATAATATATDPTRSAA